MRLDGLVYRIHLDLTDASGRRAVGDLALQASPGRLVPPIEITGARGWRTGYVVPVMSGALDGALTVAGESVSLAGGAGYHDHNWGFWRGVSWQWGQAQQGDLSLIYGRVFPPPEAADPERIPGFVGALGPDGPLGYSTDVRITETNDDKGQPLTIDVRARSTSLDDRSALRRCLGRHVADAGRTRKRRGLPANARRNTPCPARLATATSRSPHPERRKRFAVVHGSGRQFPVPCSLFPVHGSPIIQRVECVACGDLCPTTTTGERAEGGVERKLCLLSVPAAGHACRHVLTPRDLHPEAVEAERPRPKR